MKRIIKSILFVIFTFVLFQVHVMAFVFTEKEFTIEIPDGEQSYYYTPYATNMTGTMLDNAQNLNVLCLIGVYENSNLIYTIKMERKNIDNETLVSEIKDELINLYSFSDVEPKKIQDKHGSSIKGKSIQNSGYDVEVLYTNSDPTLVFTVTYSVDGGAYDQAMNVISTIIWEDMPENKEVVEDKTPVSSGKENTLEPMQPISESENKESVSINIQFRYYDIAVLILIIIVIFSLIKFKKNIYKPKYSKKYKK